jgi:acyl-CoA thioester hydrolase
MGEFLKTWAGECSAWECDGLGHLNMRHYITKAAQARQMFFIRLGLHEAFKSGAEASVRVRDFHIKYLGEARPDDPLRIETGLLQLGESDVRLCHIMYHLGGRVAATIVENVQHIALPSGAKLPWTQRFREAAKPYQVEPPAPSLPRGLSYEAVSTAPTETALKNLGVTHVGSGVFQPYEMGVNGRVTPQALMGRVTETIGHIQDGYPEFKDPDYHASGKSGALLEARIFIHRAARAGDGYHFYSGLAEGGTYTRSLIHHCVDAVTGESFFSMVGIGCLFDLKARKLIKATPEQIAVLEQNMTKGLTV